MRLVVRLHCRHSCYVVIGCYITIAIANAISLLLLLPLLYRYCYCRCYITIAITDAILRLLLLMLYNYCRCYIAVAVADAMSLLRWLMLFRYCCCRCVIDVAGAISLLLLPYRSLLPCRSLLLYRWRHCWFACWCCIAVSARSWLLLLGHHWAIVQCSSLCRWVGVRLQLQGRVAVAIVGCCCLALTDVPAAAPRHGYIAIRDVVVNLGCNYIMLRV